MEAIVFRIRQTLIFLILTASLLIGQSPAFAAPASSIAETTILAASLPVSGTPVPELDVFDQTMQNYMNARNIKAGVLVVMKDGAIVLEHGYGWKDKTLQTPIQPDAMFRLASIIKPVTEASILKLTWEGKISLDDRVFCVTGSPSNCELTISPFGTPDSRLKDITIQNLMDHEGGWDRDLSGDPMFKSITIANALGVASPPSKEDTVRYMMGQPLDHTPGTQYAYSNFGYLLLGLIIEKNTGQTYTAYIQDNIFNPLGVADTEIELGRTLPQYRNPREPWYSEPLYSGAPNVFNPSETVPWPDGGWYLEAMEAHGGMISTGRAMAEFLNAYWINGEPRNGNGQTWWFYGSLDGTYTLAYQRPDGVNLVALFNQRADASYSDYSVIKSLLDTATDSVTQWPTSTIFTDVPSSYWAAPYIESLYNAGITGGCSTSPLMYCPESTVTRAQMAVFILRGIHGSAYVPPTATGTVFTDVPADYWAASWIEQLAVEGITSGCGGTSYCPDATVTRAQMAVFLLRGKYGSTYTPPAATGTVFADIPSDYWAANWIEQLATEGITSGCGGGLYCPDAEVTRAQMAVFLVKTFNLP